MAASRDADALRQEALSRLRGGDVAGGARALALGWRSHPVDDLFPAALLAVIRAHPDQFAGIAPPRDHPSTRVSVVICSVDDGRFDAARRSYQWALAPHPGEIIRVTDAHSLAEGYRRGLAQAHGDIVVFSHDDVRVLSRGLANALIDALSHLDLVGVVGTTRLTGPAWGWSGRIHGRGRIVQPHPASHVPGLHLLSFPEAVTPGLQALDGAFLAARRETALQLGFDSEAFDGFHLYDLDFSYRASRAGLRVGVSQDILVCHESQGEYGPAWRVHADRFCAKFQVAPVAHAGPPLPAPIWFGEDDEVARACSQLDAVCRALA